MSKICTWLFTRPEVNVPVEQRHRALSGRLLQSSIGPDWNLSELPTLKDKLGDLSACASVTKYLPKSVSGQINLCWSSDEYLEDHEYCDDSLALKFNSKTYALRWFVNNIFVNYVDAFNCYLATLFGEKIGSSIHQLESDYTDKTTVFFDRRYRIFIFHQVCFFDEVLCQRAFSMSVNDMFRRLNGNIELAQIIGSGILIADQLDNYIEDVDELLAHDLKIRRLLGIEVYR